MSASTTMPARLPAATITAAESHETCGSHAASKNNSRSSDVKSAIRSTTTVAVVSAADVPSVGPERDDPRRFTRARGQDAVEEEPDHACFRQWDEWRAAPRPEDKPPADHGAAIDAVSAASEGTSHHGLLASSESQVARNLRPGPRGIRKQARP